MFCLLVNLTLRVLILNLPDGSLTHFSTAVTEFLRSFIPTLDRLLEFGIIILVGEFITKSLDEGLFQDLIRTSVFT
jgi:hypothetical protein